ncbi:TetR family transcriptional regulator C-terminal domain-containing protein [Novosphingobium huizhouense]|uniref:TetR family transcriptional regulator C-terminal domain-containing protein n=1 Tax=Novosphingobium huizhouense TaxID=2866625 RepID=UPI001CD83451|nr:TetR family transcriptional regulator C-terminal domain-containing protein [Novosphingobium huizhouense]
MIDHDARRNTLAEIAADLVATGGAEAATVRAVAAAAGFSTKAVTHYFPDKRALMLLTYRHAALTSKARTDASQPKDRGDLGALFRALLPIDPRVTRDWRVWFCFWGMAIADPEYAAEQRERMRAFVAQIEAVLAADPDFAHIAPGNRPAIASALFAQLVGIVTQATFDAEHWPPLRQVEAIDGAISRVRGWEKTSNQAPVCGELAGN